MSQRITIEIKDKIATCVTESPIVCGNADYVVDFVFDEEWEKHEIKTAIFVVNGKAIPQVFEGNVCPVPVIQNTLIAWVGVFAGTVNDGTLSTSTPALVKCIPCITDGDNVPLPPPDDVYNQIIGLIEAGMLKGEQGEEGPGGLSAYEVAVKNGFAGTEEEWLKALKATPIQPDYEQNDPEASDYIKNKPFESEKCSYPEITYRWATNAIFNHYKVLRETNSVGDLYWVKISEDMPSVAHLLDGKVTYFDDGGYYDYDIKLDMIAVGVGYHEVCMTNAVQHILVVTDFHQAEKSLGLPFTENGLYTSWQFRHNGTYFHMYNTAIALYQKQAEVVTKQLDEKFIPASIARTADVKAALLLISMVPYLPSKPSVNDIYEQEFHVDCFNRTPMPGDTFPLIAIHEGTWFYVVGTVQRIVDDYVTFYVEEVEEIRNKDYDKPLICHYFFNTYGDIPEVGNEYSSEFENFYFNRKPKVDDGFHLYAVCDNVPYLLWCTITGLEGDYSAFRVDEVSELGASNSSSCAGLYLHTVKLYYSLPDDTKDFYTIKFVCTRAEPFTTNEDISTYFENEGACIFSHWNSFENPATLLRNSVHDSFFVTVHIDNSGAEYTYESFDDTVTEISSGGSGESGNGQTLLLPLIVAQCGEIESGAILEEDIYVGDFNRMPVIGDKFPLHLRSDDKVYYAVCEVLDIVAEHVTYQILDFVLLQSENNSGSGGTKKYLHYISLDLYCEAIDEGADATFTIQSARKTPFNMSEVGETEGENYLFVLDQNGERGAFNGMTFIDANDLEYLIIGMTDSAVLITMDLTSKDIRFWEVRSVERDTVSEITSETLEEFD